MKKILGSLLLLFVMSTSWVSAQCPGIVSPEPTCIRVLANGDVEVDYDIASMGGTVPADIDEIRLERAVPGGAFSTVANVTNFSAWPNPPMLTDVGADATNNDWVYRFVAVCLGPPLTDLTESSPIKPIILSHTITNDFEVNLSWNWDSLSSNLNPTTVNRKLPYSTN